jgi:hypothetical protein
MRKIYLWKNLLEVTYDTSILQDNIKVDLKYIDVEWIHMFFICYLTTLSVGRLYSLCNELVTQELAEETELLEEHLQQAITRGGS